MNCQLITEVFTIVTLKISKLTKVDVTNFGLGCQPYLAEVVSGVFAFIRFFVCLKFKTLQEWLSSVSGTVI